MLGIICDVLKYVIIGAVLLLVVHLLLWFLSGPVRYRKTVDDDLSRFFKALIFSPYEKVFFVIEAPNKNRYLRFERYQLDGEFGGRFDFPLATWSERYYDSLAQLLSERGIGYQTTEDKNSVSYITVDLKQD